MDRTERLVKFIGENRQNWQNIVTVKSKLPEIREFVEKARIAADSQVLP